MPKLRCQEKVSISKEKGSGYPNCYIKAGAPEKQKNEEKENEMLDED